MVHLVMTHLDRKRLHNKVNCLLSLDNRIAVGYDSGWLLVYEVDLSAHQWKVVAQHREASSIHLIHRQHEYLVTLNSMAEVIKFHLHPTTGELKIVQKIEFPLQKLPIALSSIALQGLSLLFIGGVDFALHCYSADGISTEHDYRFSLAGHENGIIRLAVAQDSNDYLIASSSHDGYIRLWRLTPSQQAARLHKNVKKVNHLYMYLDAVLISHETAVHGLTWMREPNSGLRLLSASLDCTVCVWSCETEGAWTVESRMGQSVANKNAYFEVKAHSSSKLIAAVNFTGAVLLWSHPETGVYNLKDCFGGHSRPVTSISWDSSGSFLASTSKDQTTRLHALCRSTKAFHEISRAQIHGYDINAVEMIKVKDSVIDVLVCGADEKVLRVLEPPAVFANCLNSFTLSNLHLYFESRQQELNLIRKAPTESSPLLYEVYTEGGTQVLGLMTKMQRVQREKIVSYYGDEDQEAQEEGNEGRPAERVSDHQYSNPPHEDFLVKHTLWPEMNKLYGHPQEISCICRHPTAPILVSACKGLDKTDSTMIVWDVVSWRVKKLIPFHNFTVFGICFTRSGKHMVSVSKDRKMAVFDHEFNLLYSYEAHTRTITAVSTSPQQGYIVTSSKDKTIRLHSIVEQKELSKIEFAQPVTAVQFGPNNIVGYGCADGSIGWLKLNGNTFTHRSQVEEAFCSSLAINSARWNGSKMAVCSDDHSLRIFEVECQQ